MSDTEAWQKFQDENPTTCDASILVNPDHLQYLMNRLHRAFMAGAQFGKQKEKARIAANLAGLAS